MWSSTGRENGKTARFWTNHRTDWIKLLLHNQTIPVNNVGIVFTFEIVLMQAADSQQRTC